MSVRISTTGPGPFFMHRDHAVPADLLGHVVPELSDLLREPRRGLRLHQRQFRVRVKVLVESDEILDLGVEFLVHFRQAVLDPRCGGT